MWIGIDDGPFEGTPVVIASGADLPTPATVRANFKNQVVTVVGYSDNGTGNKYRLYGKRYRTWSTVQTNIPAPLTPVHSVAHSVHGHKLYIYGGHNGAGTCGASTSPGPVAWPPLARLFARGR